jgi:ATP-binding cassette subfamily B protein
MAMTFTAPGESLRDIFGRFWPFMRGDRCRLLAAGLCGVVVAGGEIGTVVIFDAILTGVLAHERVARLWPLAAAWLGIAAVAAAAMFTASYAGSLASERFLLRLRDSVYAHSQKLSPDFFGQRRLGDLMVRLVDDVELIEQMVASGLVQAAAAAVSVLLFVGAAFLIQWELALITCVVAPLFWLATRGFSGRLGRATGRERAVSGSLTSVVEESLANQALVQALNRQPDQARRLHEEGVSWLRAKMAEAKLDSLYGPVVYFVETVCILIVFGFGAWEVTDHKVSIGGLLSFAILLTFIYPEVQELTGYRVTISAGQASAQRVSEILQFKPLVTDHPAGRPAAAGRGRIDVERVTFAYPGAPSTVIDELSFTAEPGKLLAVTGPSGAGKSTLAHLLLRFYDPGAGRILLDRTDIRDLPLRALRDNISLLQQEHLLFAATIRDNIAYARPTATSAEIQAAARAADAHDFITALPRGYDTPIGQRGSLLSGGQRRRITIARTILRDAPILILDEPTAGLDKDGAQRLLDTLTGAIAGRTTIVITHDTSLTAIADRVVSLDGNLHQR